MARRNGSDLETTWWQDRPGGLPGFTDEFDRDVWGRSLAAGAPASPAYAIAADTGEREMSPALACVSSASCLATYRKYDAGLEVDRLKGRVLSFP